MEESVKPKEGDKKTEPKVDREALKKSIEQKKQATENNQVIQK